MEDYAQSSDTLSPNTLLIIVKKEVDVITYADNNQTELSEVYYSHSLDWRDSCFNGQWGKINHGGRRHNNNNKMYYTNKKKKKKKKNDLKATPLNVLSMAANSIGFTTALTLTIPKKNSRTSKTGVIFPCLTLKWWVSSQNGRKTATPF